MNRACACWSSKAAGPACWNGAVVEPPPWACTRAWGAERARTKARMHAFTHACTPPCQQGELPVRERLCKYAREHVLLKENELYEDDGDNAGD